MAIIGPRPLLVRYLDRYNEEQRHRHDVRPGLTGYAQAHGRNAVSWEDKFVGYKPCLQFPQIRKKETVIRTKGVCPHKCRVKFLKVF